MKYIEVCKGLNDRGNIELTGRIKPEHRNYEFYISLFPYDESIKGYVDINGSVSGHKGKHFCDYIIFDVDCEDDIEESRYSAIQLVEHINRLYGISPDELFIWFSGSKGFHVAIINKIFGTLDPSEDMAEMVKNFVTDNFDDIPNIDTKIYENHRIIRVENSLNLKSNLYKIQLSFDELKDLPIESICELAKSPRDFKRSVLASDFRFNEALARDIKSKKSFLQVEATEEGFFLPGTVGNRNNHLFKQACMLFDASDLPIKSVNEIVTSINLASNNPLPAHEINSIVFSASKKVIRKEMNETLRFKTLMEIVPEWIDSVSDERKRISMLFDGLNNEFNGKLRGKLCALIGYGGSKKSLIGQNIAYHNIQAGNRTIYSNMEMSNSMLLDRFINIMIESNKSMPSDELEMLHKSGKDINEVLAQTLYETGGDKIIVSDNGNMTSEKYRELIRKVNQPIDILIVDGLSMMGGSGNELEKANQHSKELKELAKEENIFVLMIVHAAKGEELDTLDLSKKARASEKILDNSDFVITASLIREEGSEDGFYEDIGNYYCWNKRGSGRRIKRSFKIHKNSLRISETNITDQRIKGF